MVRELFLLLALISTGSSKQCYSGCMNVEVTLDGSVLNTQQLECTRLFVDECPLDCAMVATTFDLNVPEMPGQTVKSVSEIAACSAPKEDSCAIVFNAMQLQMEMENMEMENFKCRIDECSTELCNDIFNREGVEEETAEVAEEEKGGKKKAKKDKKRGKKNKKAGKKDKKKGKNGNKKGKYN